MLLFGEKKFTSPITDAKGTIFRGHFERGGDPIGKAWGFSSKFNIALNRSATIKELIFTLLFYFFMRFVCFVGKKLLFKQSLKLTAGFAARSVSMS